MMQKNFTIFGLWHTTLLTSDSKMLLKKVKLKLINTFFKSSMNISI